VAPNQLAEVDEPGFLGARTIQTPYGQLTLYGYGSHVAARDAYGQLPGHVYARYGVWVVTGPPGISDGELTSLKLGRSLSPPLADGVEGTKVPTRGPSFSPPDIVKACGAINPAGRRLKVDIDEGHLPTTCGQARQVMLQYVDGINGGSADVDGCCSKRIRVASDAWDCYKARLDGEGWDYHCDRLINANAAFRKAYSDIGAGRRTHRDVVQAQKRSRQP
jgi:hypothetical protein